MTFQMACLSSLSVTLANHTRAIGEVVAFINGARTLEDLEKYGCPKVFWDRWVTKEKCEIFGLDEGDLGGGSYGAALAAMPMPDGNHFNQIEALIKQMQRMPFLRTHMITTWYPPYALGDKEQNSPRQVVVAPCHGNIIQFNVFDKEMHMIHYQRSADAPVGLVLNLAEWVAFGMMVAHMTGLNFTQYTHYLPNPQIMIFRLIVSKSYCLESLADSLLSTFDPREKSLLF